MFGQFFISGSQIPANALTAESYDTPLVLLSYLIASLTAYATILVFHQIVSGDSKSRTRGTFFAAAILGAGIWLTHFLGTIALKTPISQTAGGSFTALSVLAAVLLSWLAVHTTLRGGFTARCILLTALILGIATSLPDYLNREAMLIDGQARYRPGLFALSLFIPVAGAATTLTIMRLAEKSQYRCALLVIASLVGGTGICATHYTALAAMVFVPSSGYPSSPDQGNSAFVPFVVIGFAALTGLVLLLQRIVEGRSGIGRQIKWHYIYYFLAALDITTVCVSLYLNNNLFDLIGNYANEGAIWSGFRNKTIEIGFQANTINQSGNDAIRNRDAEDEKKKFSLALEKYSAGVRMLRASIEAKASESDISPEIRPLLDGIITAFSDIEAFGREASTIATTLFDYVSAGREWDAYSSMEELDQLFARQNLEILDVASKLGEVQTRLLERRAEHAARLRNYEYLILFLIVGMVGAATYYGRKINRQVKKETEERIRELSIKQNLKEIQSDYNKIRESIKHKTTDTYINLIFEPILRRLLLITNSEFGFVGEVNYDGAQPYLKVFSFTFINPESEKELRSQSGLCLRAGVEVRNLDGLLGKTLKTQQLVIANSPASKAHGHISYPKGHPHISAYLELPAISGDRVVGLVGLANAPRGYSNESAESLEPIIASLTATIESLRADAARAALEEKYAAHIQTSPAIAFTCDIDRKSMKTVSELVERITGYKPDDLVYDKVRSFASIIHPEDRAAAMESAASSLKDSGQYKIEYRVICANGSIKWLSEQGIQIDLNGPIIEGSILDITELRKQEEELLRHKNNLQNIVDIHTKEVIRKVKQASRAKSDFLSNMSHELRTPMHAILRFADMSLTAVDEQQPDLVKRYINNIRISGDRLLRLINDILDMSKLESGKMNYKKEKCDLSVVISNAIVELKPLLQDKELQISTNLIADSSDAVFDRYRITQVLVNLLSNAIKFSDKGKQIQIHLSDGYTPDGNPVLSCSVIDEGPGIPGTELTTVFDKFTQGKKIKCGAGGTGLGLAICREIVEAHGGMIWAENVQPRGASFNFCIPRSSVASVHLGGRRESQAIGC